MILRVDLCAVLMGEGGGKGIKLHFSHILNNGLFQALMDDNDADTVVGGNCPSHVLRKLKFLLNEEKEYTPKRYEKLKRHHVFLTHIQTHENEHNVSFFIHFSARTGLRDIQDGKDFRLAASHNIGFTM